MLLSMDFVKKLAGNCPLHVWYKTVVYQGAGFDKNMIQYSGIDKNMIQTLLLALAWTSDLIF